MDFSNKICTKYNHKILWWGRGESCRGKGEQDKRAKGTFVSLFTGKPLLCKGGCLFRPVIVKYLGQAWINLHRSIGAGRGLRYRISVVLMLPILLPPELDLPIPTLSLLSAHPVSPLLSPSHQPSRLSYWLTFIGKGQGFTAVTGAFSAVLQYSSQS